MGIQILRALTSSQIIAVDISEAKLKTAEKMGADVTILSDADAPEKVIEQTKGQGAEVVLDFVGIDSTLGMAAKMAKKMGHLALVGAGGGTVPVSSFSPPTECRVYAPMWGSLPELMEVLALAERGRIKSHNTYHPLEDALKVYDSMRNGTLEGRAVILPNE